MGSVISKIDLARQAGVDPAVITRLTKPGKRLEPALIGKKLNPHHPLVVAYLEEKGRSKIIESTVGDLMDQLEGKGLAVSGRGRQGRRKAEHTPGDPDFVPSLPKMATLDVRQIQQWPLIDVIKTFGSDVGLKDCVAAVKSMRDIERKEFDNSEKRGDLLSRERVDRVFSVYDESNSRMLDDMPTKLAALIHGIMDQRPTKEKLVEIIRKELSKEAKGTKAKVRRAIRQMRPKKTDDVGVTDE